MESVPPRICVVGSANIDLTFRTTRLPRPGETLAGHAFQQGFGGKGANQAVMAARFGARVTMVAKVGRDSFGDRILDNFRDEGIDAAHVHRDDSRGTGVAGIVVDEEAQNCILVVPGANLALTPEEIRQAADTIRQADVVVGQLEVPLETTWEAFRIARRHGVRTILNPAPAAPLADELLSLTDLCIPNETELELLTGKQAGSLAEIERAAQQIRGRGTATVIVTLGRRGALLVDQSGGELVPPVQVQAVDPSGAGDSFIGSLAVFLATGMTLRDALAKANLVAALSVTRPGTQAAFPRPEEVDNFLRNRMALGRGDPWH
jgi:ribokinase